MEQQLVRKEAIMKIVLAGINAKFIHSNLAIRNLRAYADKYKEDIFLKEFTINHYTDDILHELYREKPDFIGFSVYIWNLSMVEDLTVELKKVLPNTKIWLGGPEVSYNTREYLKTHKSIDGIMVGEGEATFLEVLEYHYGEKEELKDIRGIVYRERSYDEKLSIEKSAQRNEDSIIATLPRPELHLSDVPFCYEELDTLEHKIIYYESSRGCPYSCSYCLSSIDKRVRLRDLELVKKELDFFLERNVPQVKFVDRTFNCNKNHTLGIWRHIKEKDNGVTNFHFEISADILRDEEITLLNSMRPGLVQLEIGVQSTNDETIDAISRKMNFEILKGIVYKIQAGNNVHQHLDLIAGLPFESYDIFRQSFNEVYGLKPDQFQLGFLKVLKGSAMYYDSERFGIVYQEKPPYEVLSTKWLTFDDVLLLKGVEEMVEVYYNSGQFRYACTYMEHFFETPFDLYHALADYYDKMGLQGINHSRVKRYEILLNFMTEESMQGERCIRKEQIDIASMRDILIHDMYLRERLKNRPDFASEVTIFRKTYRDFLGEEKLYEYMLADKSQDSITTSELLSYVHIEAYETDVEKTAKTGNRTEQKILYLYDYLHRNPLNYEARVLLLTTN